MSTGPTFGHSLEKKHVQRPMAGVSQLVGAATLAKFSVVSNPFKSDHNFSFSFTIAAGPLQIHVHLNIVSVKHFQFFVFSIISSMHFSIFRFFLLRFSVFLNPVFKQIFWGVNQWKVDFLSGADPLLISPKDAEGDLKAGMLIFRFFCWRIVEFWSKYCRD